MTDGGHRYGGAVLRRVDKIPRGATVTAARRAGAGGRSRRSDSLPRVRVLVITWAPGGNLLPMLAVASALDRRGHEVMVLASGETRGAAEQLGFQATAYRRSPDPDLRIAFEEQADLVMARMAGPEIALDARDVLDELRPDLAIVDCMLPAAIAAARATAHADRLACALPLRARQDADAEGRRWLDDGSSQPRSDPSDAGTRMSFLLDTR